MGIGRCIGTVSVSWESVAARPWCSASAPKRWFRSGLGGIGHTFRPLSERALRLTEAALQSSHLPLTHFYLPMSLLHSAVEDGELAIVVGRSPKGAQLLHLTSRQTLAVPGLQDVPTGAWVELRTGHTPVQITDLLQTQLYTGLENPEFSRIEVSC